MKRRVLSLVTVFTLLAILALVAVLIRIPTSIDYIGQIIEYSTVDSEISIKHDIAIEGIYYDNALGRDSFQGTFYISDIEGIGKNLNNVHFDFNPQYRYCPIFYNDYGEPIGSGIAQIFFDKNFSVLAVQLTGTNGDSSRFLVLNAADRKDALSQYTALLESKELKNY